MTTCSRCGLEEGGDRNDQCSAYYQDNGPGVIACRDRQIRNLHSLLRSVTGKLEEAHDMIDGVPGSDAEHSKKLIASVLEALS